VKAAGSEKYCCEEKNNKANLFHKLKANILCKDMVLLCIANIYLL